jgi:hypothetical protein
MTGAHARWPHRGRHRPGARTDRPSGAPSQAPPRAGSPVALVAHPIRATGRPAAIGCFAARDGADRRSPTRRLS